jgi:Leucine-rich repeat (LRR) protein
LPQNALLYLNVGRNDLKELPPLPGNLGGLCCESNHLETIPPLPERLRELRCEYNPIKQMPLLPDQLCQLEIEHTTIYDTVLQADHIDMIKLRINTLYHFRVTYYTRKYGWIWRNWLWMKVRLPKILQANHPHRLQQALQENDDLEVVMETFGIETY